MKIFWNETDNKILKNKKNTKQLEKGLNILFNKSKGLTNYSKYIKVCTLLMYAKRIGYDIKWH